MQIDHIGYLVKNIEKSICEFKKIGFDIINIDDRNYIYDEDRRCYIAFLVLNNTKIELVQPYDEESKLYSLLKNYSNQPYHICLTSENLKRDEEFLSSNGFSTVIEKQKAVAFKNRNVVFMFNNGTGIIELLEK